MSRTIVLKKATRIEGHADIRMEIRDGKVSSAQFLVQDFRGLEKFLQGKRVEAIPDLVSRICGLCSVSHQVAGYMAVEDALGVVPPSSVRALREAALLGEWISSHALSYFFLTLPDFTGGARGIFDLLEKEPHIAGKAMKLRRSGQRIVEIVGKRSVHPVTLGIGRFSVLPVPEEIEEILTIAGELEDLSRELLAEVDRSHRPPGRISFPAGQRLNFVHYESQNEIFRVNDREGKLRESFPKERFAESISELRAEWSYAKFPYLESLGFPEGIMLVGPLSRVFRKGGILDDPETAALPLAGKIGTPSELSPESYDICRLLEIHWAARGIRSALTGIDLSEAVPDFDSGTSGRGTGVVEAPRGVLLHSYLVNKGRIERLRLLVATQFNNPFINLLLKDIASRHIDGDKLTQEGEKLIGMCIRHFDPCLSCATH
jgi:NAD-reducing hydrogenase large subunit